MKYNKKEILNLALIHLFLIMLGCIIIFVPKTRNNVKGYGPMMIGLVMIELLFLFFYIRKKKTGKKTTGPMDITGFIWIFLIIWDLCTSVMNLGQPVLIPCPENVFEVFAVSWEKMLGNIIYSMKLLLTGFITGLLAAVILGVITGMVPRVKAFAMPIANVMAPIPAIVISPYLVSLMPTFRSASFAVIVLGVFWPNFLSTVIRIQGIEPRIMDSARLMNPSLLTMITRIILPYLLPGIISGLKVSLTTSMLMLNFAELMGATSGMGFYVQNSIAYANYTQAVAGIMVIGIVVTLLNILVEQIQKNVVRWK